MKPAFGLKKPAAELPPEIAEQMLANVFAACEREQNSVSLETLSSYSNYRKERYALQRTIILVVLLLFMLLPLLFFAGRIDVNLANPGSNDNPVYAVNVASAIPVLQVQAEMDGRNVPIYEISPRAYAIQPRENGKMQVQVTLLNRQLTSMEVEVGAADADAPSLMSTEVQGDYLCLYVQDDGSGVDFNEITLTDLQGVVTVPVRWDEASGCVVLNYPECSMRVSIPDLRGNALQIDLKPE